MGIKFKKTFLTPAIKKDPENVESQIAFLLGFASAFDLNVDVWVAGLDNDPPQCFRITPYPRNETTFGTPKAHTLLYIGIDQWKIIKSDTSIRANQRSRLQL